MLNLIKSTKAEGVIFISGDVHWGEISKLQDENLYPIYDITPVASISHGNPLNQIQFESEQSIEKITLR